MNYSGLHPHIVQGVQTTKRVGPSKRYTRGRGTTKKKEEGGEIVEMFALHRFTDRM